MEIKRSQEFAPMKENSEKSSSIVKIEQHEETPFGIVETDKEGEFNCFVAIGNKRLTPMMTREECERMIDLRDWTLITQLIMHIQENAETIQKINEALKTKGGL